MALTIEQIQTNITNKMDARLIINQMADYIQANPGGGTGGGVESVTALLEATSGEPTVTPMGTNTLGNGVWNGTGGVYSGTYTGKFAGGYSKVFVSALVKDGAPPYLIRYTIDDADTITLYVYDSAFGTSGDVTMCFKIEVYE